MSEADIEWELVDGEPLPPNNNGSVPFAVSSFGLTDAGRARTCNQDQFAILELARVLKTHATSVPQAESQYSSHRGHVFLVADGLGGHKGGEVASAMTVITIEGFLLNTLNRFFNIKPSDEQEVLKEFQSALLQADAKLFDEASRHPELLGMGTTLTMAFAVDWKLFIAHAGDSRCYLFSKDKLHQLTQDHTASAEIARWGASSHILPLHPGRHILTNALGGDERGVEVELHKLDLEPGDIILLCSDGLTGMLSDDRIAAILQKERQPQLICERLLNEANENGAPDNVTAVAGTFSAS